MAIYTREEAKKILEKALSFSKADACEINLSGSNSGNIRYARNTVSTAGYRSTQSLAVQSSFGKKWVQPPSMSLMMHRWKKW